MKKTFQMTKRFVSMLTVFAMLCTLFAGVTVFADGTTSKEPTHVIATSKGDNLGVQIAWKNPTDTTLVKTEVYKINNLGENQTYTLVQADNAPVAGAYTYARETFATPVTASTTLYYKVVCTFQDGTTSDVVTYVNPYFAWATLGNQPFIDGSKYVVNRYAANTNYSPTAKIELDWEVKNGDGPSAHIKSSRTSNDNGFEFRYAFPARTDGEYLKITFKYKAEGLTGNTYVQLPLSYANASVTNATTNELMRFTGTTDGWVERSFVRKVGACPFVQFNVQTPGDIWIDDMSVYLCDAEGTVSGDNLVTMTETYASNYYASHASISAPVVADSNAYDGAADLTWNGVAGATAYRVYQKEVNGSLALRAEYPSSVTYAKFDNLVNDTAYTYVVKAVDALTKESSESNAVTVTPQAPVVEALTKEPTSVFTTPRNDSKGVQIAWKNPTDTTLVKTEVYKINNFGLNQTYTLVPGTPSSVPGAYTYVRDEYDTAYTASTYVYYKLVCTFQDESTTELVTYTDAFANKANLDNTAFLGTSSYNEHYFWANASTYVQATGAKLDWEDYSGTGPSIHIESSRTSSDRHYSFYFNFAKMTEGTPFKLKYKYKTKNLTVTTPNSDFVFVQMPNVYSSLTATSVAPMQEVARYNTDTDGWVAKEHTMKAGSNTPWVRFIIQIPGELWIDDVALVVLDENGAETNTNLITSIDSYATNYYTTNGRLAAPTISDSNPIDGGAEIIWNGVTGAKEYNVYAKDGDNLTLVATLPAAQTSVKFDGLTNGTSYTYVVKTVDMAKEESTVGSEVTVVPAIPQVAQSEKEPTHVVATPKLNSKGVEVAWKNPTASTLVKTEVYRVDNIESNPTETLVATNNAPVPGTYTYARDEYDTAYTASTNVFYKLVCTFQDGSSNEVSVYTDAYVSTTRGDYPFVEQDVWGTTNGQSDANRANGKYWQGVKTSLDFDTYAGDAGPSIHIDASSTADYADYQLKFWLKDGAYIPNNSYAKIEYKVKTNQPAGSILFAMFGGSEITRYTASTNWTTKSVVKKNGGVDAAGRFFYFILRGAGEYWVDDVALYACDENGNLTTGENLLVRPEEYITDSYYAQNPLPQAPVISNTEVHDSSVDISWGAVANATGYEVYEKAEDGAYYLRASVPASITTVRLNRLRNNNAYDFVVKAMDVTTKGSAFSAVSTLTPIPDPFKVTPYQITRSGNSLTVSATMTNGTFESGIDAQLILAVYKKGTVHSMTTVGLSEDASIAISENETLSATVTLPNDYTAEGYVVKAFLWESVTSLKPWIDTAIIAVP